MTFEEAQEYLGKVRENGSSYGLDGIKMLMKQLHDVHRQLKILHVAGTNGKGSVCAMLMHILSASGAKVGKYSSPAVFDSLEQYQINGVSISGKEYGRLVRDVQEACRRMVAEGLAHPTAFEIETAVAFCYFYDENCDYVVLETGLGGMLDATNLIEQPLCSVITSISRDHMVLLGDSIEEIASAKAGIIKPGCTAVTSYQQEEAFAVLQRRAADCGSKLWAARDMDLTQFTYDKSGCSVCYRGREFHTPLTGACQRENIACVLTVVEALRAQGILLPWEAVGRGLAKTRLPGRMERICDSPEFYLDGAHNEGAARLLAQTVQQCFATQRIVYIIGVLADKEYEKVLALMLPYAEQVFTVTPDNPRALDGRLLAQVAGRKHGRVTYVPGLSQAAEQAAKAAGADGVVLAFGSLSYLGELKRIASGWKLQGDGSAPVL